MNIPKSTHSNFSNLFLSQLLQWFNVVILWESPTGDVCLFTHNTPLNCSVQSAGRKEVNITFVYTNRLAGQYTAIAVRYHSAQKKYLQQTLHTYYCIGLLCTLRSVLTIVQINTELIKNINHNCSK